VGGSTSGTGQDRGINQSSWRQEHGRVGWAVTLLVRYVRTCLSSFKHLPPDLSRPGSSPRTGTVCHAVPSSTLSYVGSRNSLVTSVNNLPSGGRPRRWQVTIVPLCAVSPARGESRDVTASLSGFVANPCVRSWRCARTSTSTCAVPCYTQ
jgi:hypothetical protein